MRATIQTYYMAMYDPLSIVKLIRKLSMMNYRTIFQIVHLPINLIKMFLLE